MVESKMEKGISLICELEEIFKNISDEEFDSRLFERIDFLLLSILDPGDLHNHSSIAEFLVVSPSY